MTDIKVGSEWMLKAKNDRRCKIFYVGKEKIFAEWSNGAEGEYDIEDFLDKYKPAPVRRTVWLNVYKDEVRMHETNDWARFYKADDILWQQEVVLIDPREGEKG